MPISGNLITLLGALAALVVLALIVAASTGRLRPFLEGLLGPRDSEPQYRKRLLLSPAELSFLEALDRAIPDIAHYLARPVRVYSKVRLADLIEPDTSRSNSKVWMSWFGRISQKHADFVLASGQETLCVIELDDKSHNAPKQRAKDTQQDRALATAGLPIVRIRARRGYNLQDVMNTITNAMSEREPIPPARNNPPKP